MASPKLDEETRAQLLSISPATVDRLLKRVRERIKPHGLSATKPGILLKHTIPIFTFAQWDDAQPGFMEIDLVAHCGDERVASTSTASTWWMSAPVGSN